MGLCRFSTLACESVEITRWAITNANSPRHNRRRGGEKENTPTCASQGVFSKENELTTSRIYYIILVNICQEFFLIFFIPGQGTFYVFGVSHMPCHSFARTLWFAYVTILEVVLCSFSFLFWNVSFYFTSSTFFQNLGSQPHLLHAS